MLNIVYFVVTVTNWVFIWGLMLLVLVWIFGLLIWLFNLIDLCGLVLHLI